MVTVPGRDFDINFPSPMQKLNVHWIIGPLALAGMLAYAMPLTSFLEAILAEEIVASVVDRDFANYWMAGQLVRVDAFIALFSQPNTTPIFNKCSASDTPYTTGAIRHTSYCYFGRSAM